MNKHTPGPWTILGDFKGAVSIQHAEDSMSVICKLNNRCGQPFHAMNEDANAALIAAAPDLLNMIECLLESGELNGVGAEEYEQIEKLIRKARGE